MARTGKYSTTKLQKSFAIVVVACVAIIFFSSFDDIQAKARDTRRQSDAKDVNRALELYYDRYAKFPEVVDDDYSGWDTTYEPDQSVTKFIPQLESEGILNATPRDPVNDKVYFYRYRKFPSGSYGCKRPFVIFQVFNFETIQPEPGSASCPELDFVEQSPNGYTIQKFE